MLPLTCHQSVMLHDPSVVVGVSVICVVFTAGIRAAGPVVVVALDDGAATVVGVLLLEGAVKSTIGTGAGAVAGAEAGPTPAGTKAGTGPDVDTGAGTGIEGGFEVAAGVEDVASTVTACSFGSLDSSGATDAASLSVPCTSVFFGGPGASGSKNRAGTPVAA